MISFSGGHTSYGDSVENVVIVVWLQQSFPCNPLGRIILVFCTDFAGLKPYKAFHVAAWSLYRVELL